MNKTIIDSTIETIKSELEELNKSVNKCDNRNALNFAKIIGEEFTFARDKLSSIKIGFGRKLELGDEIMLLETKFEKINEKFNNCKCEK